MLLQKNYFNMMAAYLFEIAVVRELGVMAQNWVS